MRLGTIPVKILQHNIQTINSLNPNIALMLGNQFVVDWRDLEKTRCADALDKIQASKVKARVGFFLIYKLMADMGL